MATAAVDFRLIVWTMSLAAPMSLGAAALVPTYLNHDAGWYLHMAGAWLDGATLYRDVVDTNPPLIVFLSAAPVWLARVVGFSEPAVFKVWIFLLGAGCAALAVSPIRRVWDSEPARLLMMIALAFVLFPFVKDEFGQREHIAAILTAPFALEACAWAAGRAAAVRRDTLAGVLGGLGLALKPHFLLAWLALEAAVVAVRPGSGSWRRPAAFGAAATILCYAIAVVVFVPEYLATARDVVSVYGGLNEPASVLLRVPELRLWIAALVALALLRGRSRRGSPAFVLFAVATGFFAAAMLQRKGWGYHFYPFRAFVLVFFAAVANAMVEAYPGAIRVARGARTVTAVVLLVATLWSARAAVQARRAAGRGYAASLIALIERQPRAESMALLSMRFLLYPAFPAVNYTSTSWVLRHNSLWFLPGLYRQEIDKPTGEPRFRSIDTMPPLERKFFHEVVEDLCARPPRLLVVEPPAPGAPPGLRSLDLLAYYAQDPRVATLLRAYTPIDRIGPFVAYSRASDASCTAASVWRSTD